jgi:hypothetical protein
MIKAIPGSKMKRSIRLLRFLVFSILVLIALRYILVWVGRGKTNVQVYNKTALTVRQCTVETGKRSATIQNLGQGMNAIVELTVLKSATYDIRVVLDSGRVLTKRGGYVMPGFVYECDVMITTNGVTIEPRSIRDYWFPH